jgi:hypothetical protein
MTDNQKAIEHIRYEFECFFNGSNELIGRLQKLQRTIITPVDVVETALFDSFLVHLRNIYLFLNNEIGDYNNNIIAGTYLTDINTFKKACKDQYLFNNLERNYIKYNGDKLYNFSTFHLNMQRLNDDISNHQWNIQRIRELILEITKVFKKYIAEDYQNDFKFLDEYIRTEKVKVNKTNFALTPISPDEIETDQESTEHNDFSATLKTGSAFDAAMTSTSKPIYSDKP